MDNPQEQIRELQRTVEALQNTICVGRVSTVNRASRTATVILDGNTVSDRLPILHRGDNWLPSVGQNVAYLLRPGGDGIILGGIG